LSGLVPIGPGNTEVARVMLGESKGCDNLGSGTVATVLEGRAIYVEDPVFGIESSQLEKNITAFLSLSSCQSCKRMKYSRNEGHQ
jgi:hypothetical protein